MRNLKKWMLAAILICGTSAMLISCAEKEDNPVTPDPKDTLQNRRPHKPLRRPRLCPS